MGVFLNSQGKLIDRITNVSLLGKQTRPVVTAVLLMMLVTGSFAAADVVISQNADAGTDSESMAQSLDNEDLSATSTLSESSSAVNDGAADDGSDVEGITTEGAASNSATTSIKIEAHSETTVNGQSSDGAPEVIINGQSVDLPNSGTFRQNIRDDNSRTRIRARVDSNNTSLNISTNESVESGSD